MKVERSQLRGLDRRLHASVSREHDHGWRRLPGLQLLQDLEAVDLGHLDVEDDQVRAAPARRS